jgi:hypothetical protein
MKLIYIHNEYDFSRLVYRHNKINYEVRLYNNNENSIRISKIKRWNDNYPGIMHKDSLKYELKRFIEKFNIREKDKLKLLKSNKLYSIILKDYYDKSTKEYFLIKGMNTNNFIRVYISNDYKRISFNLEYHGDKFNKYIDDVYDEDELQSVRKIVPFDNNITINTVRIFEEFNKILDDFRIEYGVRL